MTATSLDLLAAARAKQRDLSYDPFHLMPRALPERPRTLLTSADVARVRDWSREHDWAKRSLARLIANADKPIDPLTNIINRLEAPGTGSLIANLISHAERNILAFLIAGGNERRERALETILAIARDYASLPLRADGRLAGGNLAESHQTYHLARACDMLESTGLSDSDRSVIHAMLRGQYECMDACAHRTCGNHNTWAITGRAALAIALGDLQGIHDALYGLPAPPIANSPDTPAWRYGLVHMLRHDILADGIHWERTLGYHFYSLMGFVEAATMLGNAGVDLWNAKLPAADESDGHDLHRGYGPPPEVAGMKTLKAAFDAPLYAAFINGDSSTLHDSGLANWRGIPIWGVLYDAAYDAYHDPRYAWLLNRMEREATKREHEGIPMSLQTHRGDLDFVRRRTAVYPAGEFTFARDAKISLTGRHEKLSTLLPSWGSAILRSSADDVSDPGAPGAYLFWGPHSAGHMNPAALHLDIHAHGKMVTATPAVGGYDDPNYLTWARTTIAHNTVTVDGRSMFPYDFDTQSIWEADSWRRRVSDGVLDLFQPENGYTAVRASNQNVYPGLKLDRTVVLTRDYLIDAFRVFADDEHEYDWAMHVHGTIAHKYESFPNAPDLRRGYQHLTNATDLRLRGHALVFSASDRGPASHCCAFLPPGANAFTARTISQKEPNYGTSAPRAERSCVIARTRAKSALYLAVWWFADVPLEATASTNDPHQPITLDVDFNSSRTRWWIPLQQSRVIRHWLP